MERIEFVRVVDPLVKAMRQTFDTPTWTIYYRALDDVPGRLLEAAVDRAAKSCRFMPKPGELREFAEEARKALIASVQFTACEQCDGTGWSQIGIDGVQRVQRCHCWKAHQQKLADLGVSSAPLALPAAQEHSRIGDDV